MTNLSIRAEKLHPAIKKKDVLIRSARFSSNFGILDMPSCLCMQFLTRNPIFKSKMKKLSITYTFNKNCGGWFVLNFLSKDHSRELVVSLVTLFLSMKSANQPSHTYYSWLHFIRIHVESTLLMSSPLPLKHEHFIPWFFISSEGALYVMMTFKGVDTFWGHTGP